MVQGTNIQANVLELRDIATTLCKNAAKGDVRGGILEALCSKKCVAGFLGHAPMSLRHMSNKKEARPQSKPDVQKRSYDASVNLTF